MKCEICDKHSRNAGGYVKTRGQYNPTGKKRKKPNLQKVKIPKNISKKKFKDFAGQKVWGCTKCLKTLNKVK